MHVNVFVELFVQRTEFNPCQGIALYKHYPLLLLPFCQFSSPSSLVNSAQTLASACVLSMLHVCTSLLSRRTKRLLDKINPQRVGRPKPRAQSLLTSSHFTLLRTLQRLPIHSSELFSVYLSTPQNSLASTYPLLRTLQWLHIHSSELFSGYLSTPQNSSVATYPLLRTLQWLPIHSSELFSGYLSTPQNSSVSTYPLLRTLQLLPI